MRSLCYDNCHMKGLIITSLEIYMRSTLQNIEICHSVFQLRHEILYHSKNNANSLDLGFTFFEASDQLVEVIIEKHFPLSYEEGDCTITRTLHAFINPNSITILKYSSEDGALIKDSEILLVINNKNELSDSQKENVLNDFVSSLLDASKGLTITPKPSLVENVIRNNTVDTFFRDDKKTSGITPVVDIIKSYVM